MDAPNLAVGDLFGAGLSNMLTLALIDIAYRQKRVWQQAALEQALIANLAVILTGLLIVIKPSIPTFHVGLGTVAIALIYLLGMRVVFCHENMRRRANQLERVVEAEEAASNHPSARSALKRALMGFAFSSVGILVAAPLLAASANEIAEATGISTLLSGHR